MQVINNFRAWLKKPEAQMGVVVFFLVLLAFGVGYLAGRDWTPTPIVIEKNSSN
ncbi:MAG: hypothetical protein AAB659_02185 [Patescibacteria group bacterium]